MFLELIVLGPGDRMCGPSLPETFPRGLLTQEAFSGHLGWRWNAIVFPALSDRRLWAACWCRRTQVKAVTTERDRPAGNGVDRNRP